jgi:hypothetical protein
MAPKDKTPVVKSKSGGSRGVTTVRLSKAREEILSKIPQKDAREALRATWIAEIKAQQAKNQEYLERRNRLEMGLTEMGFLFVNGTGTRRNAIFSKQQAQAFIAEFDQFKALVAQMDDAEGTYGGSEE